MVEHADVAGKYTLQDFEGLQEVLAIATNLNTLTKSLATELTSLLPSCVSSVLEQWCSIKIEASSWVSFAEFYCCHYVSFVFFLDSIC